MNDRDILFDPIMELIDGCSFTNVVDSAWFQNLLNRSFFLKVIDLINNLSSFLIDHWLTVQVEKGGSFLIVGAMVYGGFSDIGVENLTKRVGVAAADHRHERDFHGRVEALTEWGRQNRWYFLIELHLLLLHFFQMVHSLPNEFQVRFVLGMMLAQKAKCLLYGFGGFNHMLLLGLSPDALFAFIHEV